MSKTKFKFKVGDRVRVLDGSKIKDYTGGWNCLAMEKFVGKEAIINERYVLRNNPAYGIEGNIFTWDERGLEPIKNETIVIYRKGQEVIALDKTTGKKSVAKCGPDDEFDFNTGAKLAFDRLLGIEQPKEDDAIKVGDIVKVVNTGKMFTTNSNWVIKNVPELAVFYRYGYEPYFEGIKKLDEKYIVRFIDEEEGKAYIQKFNPYGCDKTGCLLIRTIGIKKA